MRSKAQPRILVPVDGSDGSLRALKHAAAFAEAARASLLVLNVQPGISPSRFVSRAMIKEYQQKQARTALGRARSFVRRHGVDATFHVLLGEPAPAIARFARSRGCREIVIGTRGLGKVAGLLLGSVVTKVIHLSPCPVTVVK